MEQDCQANTHRLSSKALARHDESSNVEASFAEMTRRLVQSEANQVAYRQLAQQHGTQMDILDDDQDQDRPAADPNHGPHEQATPAALRIEDAVLDVCLVHDCHQSTGLSPMERFGMMSTLEEPSPFHARRQMASMGIAEGDSRMVVARSKAAQILSEPNGRPIASSDVLNEHTQVKSAPEPRSRIQKEHRVVRRSSKH